MVIRSRVAVAVLALFGPLSLACSGADPSPSPESDDSRAAEELTPPESGGDEGVTDRLVTQTGLRRAICGTPSAPQNEGIVCAGRQYTCVSGCCCYASNNCSC